MAMTMMNAGLAALALVLVGCGPAAQGNAAHSDARGADESLTASNQNTAPAAGEKTSMDQPAQTENQGETADANREVPIRELVGNWTVEKLWVDTSGVTAYALDDPAAVGSVMAVTPETIKWTKSASDQFASEDVCGGPTPIIIRDAASAQQTGASMQAAIRYFAIPKNSLGPLHEMACSESGNWGPEAAGGSNFYPVSGGRMVMNWYDGAVLLLRRQ